MQVAKWGNSLAIRLPKAVVEALNLKAGDEVEIRLASDREMEVHRAPSRAELIEQLKGHRRTLPRGFVWSRDAAHDD